MDTLKLQYICVVPECDAGPDSLELEPDTPPDKNMNTFFRPGPFGPGPFGNRAQSDTGSVLFGPRALLASGSFGPQGLVGSRACLGPGLVWALGPN